MEERVKRILEHPESSLVDLCLCESDLDG